MIKKALAEFLGTYAIVFCGTGAIIIDEQTHGSVTHIGVSITFGLIVMSMIYAFGEQSGAHFNPAVSLGFRVAKKFKSGELVSYISSQVLGAFAASYTLMLLFPSNPDLGSTIPSGSSIQAFFLECILTYFLMLVILNVSHGSKEVGTLAGMAVGALVLLEAMFAGPISGASMNPARSLAPGILSGNTQTLWIYLTAPFIGSISAAFTWRFMNYLK